MAKAAFSYGSNAYTIAFGRFVTGAIAALALFQMGVFLCGSVKASLLSTFEPLTGVVLGVLVFREVLQKRTIGGMLLILSAVVLLVIPPPDVILRRIKTWQMNFLFPKRS